MRNSNLKYGKFFKFRNMSEWDEDDKRDTRVPKVVRAHMVVALEKCQSRPGFVKVVTVRYRAMELLSPILSNSNSTFSKVTSTQPADVDTDLMVPIAPSPKNRDTKMQLNIANVGFDWSGLLQYRLRLNSYLRVDKVYEVPWNTLEPFLWCETEHVALKKKSYESLMSFMRDRPEKMLEVREE